MIRAAAAGLLWALAGVMCGMLSSVGVYRYSMDP